ncbi:FtsX-like permease family protein [Streptomyces sp. NPDC056638]|uniref:FtsX-like permease family protein n=1 Tax=Streptomyces sp. NPDC056638 TaxID=3345887 RepID=UPI0036B33C9D
MGNRGRRTPALLRRSRHHGLVLCAAGLAVLLAATVLAALAALTERAVEGGVQRRLAADSGAAVQVAGRHGAGEDAAYVRTDKAVRAAMDDVFAGVPQHTWAAHRAPAAMSSGYPVGGADGRTAEDLTVSVVALQDQSRHARLLSGRWPRGSTTGGATEAALPRVLAARLQLRPGSRFTVDANGRGRVSLRLSGIYSAQSRSPAVWDALAGDYGNTENLVLLAPDAFTANPRLAGDSNDLWLGVPVASGLPLDGIDALAGRLDTFSGSDTSRSVFHGGPAPGSELAVLDGLADTLRELGTPIAVARAGLYIPATLLAALATAALVLTARQLAEHRRPEHALLAARGAGAPRITGAAAAQWAAVALPAGCAAPFLAGPLLRLLDRGGLVPGGVPDEASALSLAWAVALLAVAVHGAALLLPTVRAVRDRRTVSRLRQRLSRYSGAQRTGTDVALVAVAVLGWLQLRQYRSPVLAGNGSSGVDPVLVLAPVAMTTAAVLLVLRLLPLAGRLLDPMARRGTGLVLPLGGWQIGRRASRHAGPTLVVALALAVGALSATALAILDRGDHDQAVFAVGSDLRITAGPEGAGGVPTGERRAAYRKLPGVDALTPVLEAPGYVADKPVAVTGINTARGPVPTLRPDLSDRPLAGLLRPLGRTVPRHGLALAGTPRTLPLRVALSADGPGTPVPITLTVTFEDGDGLAHESSVPLRTTGTRARTVQLPVPARTRPLRILRAGLNMRGETVRRTYRLTVDRIPGATAPASLKDVTGTDVSDPGSVGCPGAEPDTFAPAPGTGPVLCSNRPRAGALLDAVLRGPDVASTSPLWDIRLAVGTVRVTPDVPALADAALLAQGTVRIGDTVDVAPPDGGALSFKVIGRIEAVPGVDRDFPRLLVDSRALTGLLAAQGRLPEAETGWLASVRGHDASAALRAVGADPRLGVATDVPHERARLADDPLRHGARGALTLCLLLAPAFAVIAFTLHTALSARDRRREFALLRAIGVRRGQLAAYLWTEQLGLSAVAALLGTLLGTLLAAAIMPVVTVNTDGQQVFPVLLTSVPWARVAMTGAATTVLICVVVGFAARFLARVDLARVLRAGDDG